MAKHQISRSQLCCFYQLFIAVDDMQCRETYTRHPLLEMGWDYVAHLYLKPYTPNQLFLDTPQKWHFPAVIINMLGILGWDHIHILGTTNTNMTSCKKGHNRCPFAAFYNYLFICICHVFTSVGFFLYIGLLYMWMNKSSCSQANML